MSGTRNLHNEPGSDGSLVSDYAIAEQLGISRARVFQIRCNAVKKLRAALLADPVIREYVVENVNCRLADAQETLGGVS